MNVFEGLKQQILDKYPSVKTLPVWDRLCIWVRTEDHQHDLTEARGTSKYTQSAVLVDWKGKTYTRRFGRLQP